MKHFFTIITMIALIGSCKNKNSDNQFSEKIKVENLKKYFITSILRDSTITLDSFKVVKLDTTTKRNGYIFMYNKIYDILQNNKDKIQDLTIDMKDKMRSYSLMADNPYGGSLLKIYKNDYEDDLAKLKSIIYNDSLYLIDLTKLDSLSKKGDSVTPIAYLTKCAYQIKNKDFSVEKDTTYIRLNKDYDIITMNEFIKTLPSFGSVSEVSFK